MSEFYQHIEEPIRELVKLLRDSGINTTSSCGHEMSVQADVLPSGYLQILDEVVFNYLTEKGQPIEYLITIHRERNVCGLTRCWAEIDLKPNRRHEV